MSAIELNLDESTNCFLLTGDTIQIKRNHRARYYFLDFLSASFDDDGTIKVPYTIKEQESTLKKIQDSLKKFGLEQTDSSLIKEVMNSYYRERENFQIFSNKAKGIWNNEVDIAEFEEFKSSVDINLPGRRLYDKQLLASFHLAFSQNACNFSVPGAGKTSVVYGAFAHLKSLPPEHPKHVNKLLIIGPLSSFGPWEDEFEECFGYRTNSKRLAGGVSKEERNEYLFSIIPTEELPELTLISYQSVVFNLDGLKNFLQRKGNRVMVVLDEAHKIKNVDGGVWAQSVLELSKYSSARVVLTGTPLPNGYEDIYNLYEFIWPEKRVLGYSVHQLKEMSENQFDERVDNLIENISPFFIRVKKSDLNLPPATDLPPIIVRMGDVQRELYEFIENKYLSYFSDNNSLSVASELKKARFIRLMQVATNPNLLRQPLESYFRDQGLSNELYIDDREIINKILNYNLLEGIPEKFKKVKEIVVNLLNKGEKVIIWATFIQNIKELQGFLSSSGIQSEVLIGETPVEKDDSSSSSILTRERIIREFHKDDSSFKVIIANPFAVAESISLHKACHNAIYLERTFNAANFIQSKDRIHRVGLAPHINTYYHYLVSEDSIDETIHRRLIEKEQRMVQLIESQEIPLLKENLDYDIDMNSDLKALIRDYVGRSSKVR